MKSIFLINGYGIPKDIFKDENMNFYLKIVFNHVYDAVISSKEKTAPVIIFSGGKTDMKKPYNKRSEAGEMIRFFKKLMSRPGLNKTTKNWQLEKEDKAISSIENILFAKEIIVKKKKITKANIYTFCEQTRVDRVEIFLKRLFSTRYKLKVIGVDFDVSANRYLDPKILNEKEDLETKYALWALKDYDNFVQLHNLYLDKLEYLRKPGNKNNIKDIATWWKKGLKNLEVK